MLNTVGSLAQSVAAANEIMPRASTVVMMQSRAYRGGSAWPLLMYQSASTSL